MYPLAVRDSEAETLLRDSVGNPQSVRVKCRQEGRAPFTRLSSSPRRLLGNAGIAKPAFGSHALKPNPEEYGRELELNLACIWWDTHPI
jgi:hypothetical protein